MEHRSRWPVDPFHSRPFSEDSDAELRLLTGGESGRGRPLRVTRRHIAESFEEAPNGEHDVAPNRHVCPEYVSHGRPGSRESAIRTANNPIELGREPRRSLAGPHRARLAPDSCHLWVLKRLEELLEPRLSRPCIIIQKGEDLAAREHASRVPCTGGSSIAGVGCDPNIGEFLLSTAKKPVIVVDDEDRLWWRKRLPANRAYSCDEIIPPVLGEGAYDYRDCRHGISSPPNRPKRTGSRVGAP